MTLMPNPDDFENAKTFDAELDGTVNGQPIRLTGFGKFDADLGVTIGEYELHDVPQGFSPFLLGICLVTGYPNVCACDGGIANPFGSSPYKYERDISLGDFGFMQLATAVRYRGDHLTSRFHLRGEVDVPPLGQVEPFKETWKLAGGYIEGQFIMRWPIKGAGTLSAHAKSSYHPTNTTGAQSRMVRSLNLRTALCGKTLRLTQLSSLRP